MDFIGLEARPLRGGQADLDACARFRVVRLADGVEIVQLRQQPSFGKGNQEFHPDLLLGEESFDELLELVEVGARLSGDADALAAVQHHGLLRWRQSLPCPLVRLGAGRFEAVGLVEDVERRL